MTPGNNNTPPLQITKFAVIIGLLLSAAAFGCLSCGEDTSTVRHPSPVGDFLYETNANHIKITSYTGSNLVVIIPCAIDGLPVEEIGVQAFCGNGLLVIIMPRTIRSIAAAAFAFNSVEAINIPCNVREIGVGAFDNCGKLTNVYFEGDAPAFGEKVFAHCSSNLTIHALLGKTGWNGEAYEGIRVIFEGLRSVTNIPSFTPDQPSR